MPVSNEAIAALFKYLGGQGYRRPDGWGNLSKGEIFAAWRLTFSDASDADLLAAGIVYVANGGEWWPNAGQLIALIPEPGPPLMGWARIWDLLCTNLGKKGRDRPPGEGWRLAERDDENEAAMVALGAAGGWKQLCGPEERLAYAVKRFEVTFNATMRATTTDRRWIAAREPRQLPGPAPRAIGERGR